MTKPSFVIDVRTDIENRISPFTFKLKEKGVTANHLTFGQVPFVIIMVYMFYIDQIFLAGLVLLISLIMDVYDGMFARITKTDTRKGHYYDKVIDLVGITGFVIGWMFYMPDFWVYLALILLLSYVIYVLNELTSVEIVGSVRSVGLIGLFFVVISLPEPGMPWMELGIYVILIVSVGGIAYKFIQLAAGKNKEKTDHEN